MKDIQLNGTKTQPLGSTGSPDGNERARAPSPGARIERQVLLHSYTTMRPGENGDLADLILGMKIFGFLLLWVPTMGTQSPHTKLEASRPHSLYGRQPKSLLLTVLKFIVAQYRGHEAVWPPIWYVGFGYP